MQQALYRLRAAEGEDKRVCILLGRLLLRMLWFIMMYCHGGPRDNNRVEDGEEL